MTKRFVFLIIILGLVGCSSTGTPKVSNFLECEAAGNPVMESYPRQCRSAEGELFVEILDEVNLPSNPGDEAVACTMDAKVCPDGSAVGRIAPNCDFAPCPGE